MVKYTAEQLYTDFKQLARIRKSNPAYANDSTYWDGGHCNWGGNHNLREDCETIARGMEKLESFKDQGITQELTKATNKGEFDSKKSTLLMKLNELTSGLQVRTGYSSSMFGICIIWADDKMSRHIESRLQECRKSLERLKSQLEKEEYKWVEELKRLELEIRQIKAKMEQNKLKAMKETDPIKKQAIIEEIEADGRLLQQKYQEHQQHSNRYRFDASKHVYDIIEAMKKAIAGKVRGGSSGGNGSGGNRRKPNEPDPFGGGSWTDPSPDNTIPRTPRSRNSNQAEPRNNQQLILIVVAVAVVMFFMLQKEPSPKYASDYDY